MKETKTERRKSTTAKTTKTRTKKTTTKAKGKKIGGLETVIKVKTRQPKIFVLDTNVLLHDWRT